MPPAYYRWLASPVTDRDWEDAHLIDAMLAIHADDPEFGYRFIADELGRVGMRTGENRVQRLCAQQQIFSATTRKEGDVRSVLSRRSTTSWSAAATTLPNLTGSG